MTATQHMLLRTMSGLVVARDVDPQTYLENYAAHFCEWIEGTVIRMAPVHEQHNALSIYLVYLLGAYLELRPVGQLRVAPFVLRMAVLQTQREPDLQVILNTSLDRLTPTYMDAPADLCIEIVSAESVTRDHGEKLAEYERAGIPEYWVVDPLRRECRFFRLTEIGGYISHREDPDGNYRTPLLPGLTVHVPTLWTERLPGPAAVTANVLAMLR